MEGRATRQATVVIIHAIIGMLILGTTLSSAQSNGKLDITPNVLPNALAANAIFSDDFNTGAIDPNKWRLGTNAGNQTAVINNALQLRTQNSVYESGWVITRNAYPARNTTIAVKVLQPNNDGDLGLSPTYNLSSIYGIYNEANFYRFYVYRNSSSGAYLLYVESKKNGVLSGIDVTGNLVINGAVYLRLRCDDTRIHFEASLDGVAWTDTYNETFALPGYTLDTSFYYELAGYKTWTNGELVVDDFSITSQTTDTQPPQISAVTTQNVTSSGAQITWQTDEAADSQVEYGLTTSYGSSSPLDPALVTSHAVTLSGLQSNTTYHCRVKSKDAAGNLATSSDFTFTTLSGDVTPPTISNVAVNNVTTSAATINWNTNEASDSQVEYGLTTSYGSSSPLDPALVTSHAVTLSGLQSNTTYHYRVKSKDAAGNLAVSNDFIFQTSTLRLEKIVLNDPLINGTLGTRTGGQFVSGGGWQVTGVNDMLVYDLGRYVESGACEVQVRNFNPSAENTYVRHHILSMFRNPWGNHHPVENQETVWDLHAGFSYDPGVKMLSWTYQANEVETIVRDPWNLSQTYQIKVTWDGNQLQYFRDGVLFATHTHTDAMQLRYLYIGRDLTVSADLATNFQNNQYPAVIGPIYSNLVVKENVSSGDVSPPQVVNIATSGLYANAARLAWTTSEPAVCYVEYGSTTAHGQKTPVLGPPAQSFGAALANLAPSQTYHYRIVALDDAGNLTTSADQTFTTLQNGVYLFKPVADTYVEQAGLYGTTRDHGNFGWMNLLSSAGRECYLRFDVSGLSGNAAQASLRLHGRQAGNSGGILRVLSTSWDENNVTWLNKPSVTGQQLGAINSVQAGQWHEVSVTPAITGNGVYNFALVGTGAAVVSLDSRESTNSQPELIVTVSSSDTPTLTVSSPNGSEWWFVGDTKLIQWSGSGSITNVKLEFSRDAGVSWRTIVTSTPNTGAYSWVVPDTVANSCMIRVADATNAAVADASDGEFFVTLSALVNFTLSPGNPVLSPGSSGSWDENIRERGWFMYENGTYHVWYGGWRGAYDYSTPQLVKLGYAYSNDGIHWTKYSGNPIYTQNWMEDVVVVKDGNTYYLYAEDEYTGDGDGALIDLYTSTNKINWTRYGRVIYPTGNGWEGSHVGTPTVWKEGNTWYMLYEGLGNGIAGQVGLATSSDGKNWTRHPNNPVLSHPFDANLDIAVDSIIKINGVYYAYSHYDAGGHNWVAGMFTSTDLIMWTAYPGNPLPYNSPVLVDNGANYFMYSLIPGTNGFAPYNLATSTYAITPPPDTTPPIISAVAASNVTSAAATISWQTDEVADSQVEYGVTTSYGSSSPLDPARATSHSVTLSGLQSNTTYHYRVKSKDAANNLATSGDFLFTTLPSAPTLALTSPNGGESWTAGAVQNITWSSTGTLSNVKLELSIDDGANWTTIAASTANDGSEAWTIPNNASNQCLVRVSDATDGNPADVSDAVFSIVAASAPAISSFAPTSGPAGTEVTIIGTNFTGATSVAFNGIPPGGTASFTVDSGTQIRATVPTGATTGKISVTNPAGTGASANDFVVTATLTLNPSDDAYVRSDQTRSNFGTATTLRMKQSSPIINSYLKFVVSGLNGTVVSAKLRMKVTVASSSGGSAYTVSNNYRGTSTPWLQSGLRFNNAPSISGTALSTIGSVAVGQVVEFEVTSAITGNGTFSFGLNNSSSTTVRYSSKEGATKPELVIQFSSGSAAKIADLGPESIESRNNEIAPLPERFTLLPNYPNPFNAETRIAYQLPERSHVKLVLRDLMGRELKILANEEQGAGTHEVGWDGRDASGNALPSGIYIYSLQADGFRSSKKLLLVK